MKPITKIIGVLKRIWAGFFSQEREPKLSIELVPYTMHGANVRSRIEPAQWKRVCSVVHKRARNSYRCQICNQSGKSQAQGFSHPVECHEIWSFNTETHAQKLKGMISLCPMCHKAKHFGLAQRQGYGDATKAHLKRINRMSSSQLDTYIKQVFQICKERSSHEWTLDLTYLNRSEFGFLNIEFTEDEAHKCENIEF